VLTYGTMFMLVGAYALARNNHVRGDVFYRYGE
jgi:TRAP-type mannitol/chloroaromatic compound transport system permease small subunit